VKRPARPRRAAEAGIRARAASPAAEARSGRLLARVQDDWSLDDVERLVRLVAETGLAEVELRRGEALVRVLGQGRADGGVQYVMSPGGGWPTPSPAPPTGGGGGAATASSAPIRDEAADDAGLHYVTASMVGTFYRRPNPEAVPFVKEGDVIQKGQIVCILEAMKILNEIESDVSGTVVKVLAADSQPVEFGERLMAVRPL